MRSAETDAVLREAAARLGQSGVDSPQFDAAELLAHAWELSRSELGRARLRGTQIPAEVLACFAALVDRRAQRVPLQHLTGVAHFRHLSLSVGPGVFIPRPETELLVSHVLDWAHTVPREHKRMRIIDFCAGSGAVGLALATELSDVDVTAVEVAPAAAAYAQRNADDQSAAISAQGSTYTLHTADALGYFPESAVDAVVSNPPYVAAELQPQLREVIDHDPAAALYGGGDKGLEFPQRLIAHSAPLLASGGILALEHAEYQSTELQGSFTQAGLISVRTLADYTGRDRITTGLVP